MVVTLCGGARAQTDEPVLHDGDRIRVWAPLEGLRGASGRFVALEAGSLVLRWDGGVRTLPVDGIEQLQLRRRVGNHLGTGALVGGAVGAGLTTVFLLGFCGDSDTVCNGDEQLRAVAIIGLPMLAVGSALGLAIGRYEWGEVRLTPASPRPGAMRDPLPGLQLHLHMGLP